MIALLTVCVRWGLRITPLLSYVFIIFVVLFLYDPPRGESEGKHVSNQFSFWSDLKYISGSVSVSASKSSIRKFVNTEKALLGPSPG